MNIEHFYSVSLFTVESSLSVSAFDIYSIVVRCYHFCCTTLVIKSVSVDPILKSGLYKYKLQHYRGRPPGNILIVSLLATGEHIGWAIIAAVVILIIVFITVLEELLNGDVTVWIASLGDHHFA